MTFSLYKSFWTRDFFFYISIKVSQIIHIIEHSYARHFIPPQGNFVYGALTHCTLYTAGHHNVDTGSWQARHNAQPAPARIVQYMAYSRLNIKKATMMMIRGLLVLPSNAPAAPATRGTARRPG